MTYHTEEWRGGAGVFVVEDGDVVVVAGQRCSRAEAEQAPDLPASCARHTISI